MADVGAAPERAVNSPAKERRARARWRAGAARGAGGAKRRCRYMEITIGSLLVLRSVWDGAKLDR
ncbi:hypothetical protein BE17_26135 [Sorangium cellulosum]|uniref:Uncharacterized protein n=1 Tax=Sorangium cellulosum TaxID=56 RepID=A0A150RQT2_SORCE|nr:hypothetical protein BE17_26135 [Sorangium cellulosum]